MEWIFDHLGLIVFALAALSFLRGVIRAAKPDQKKGQLPRRRLEEDPEAAERTRRIQEQIRRKIAERQGGGAKADVQPPPLPSAPPPRRELIPPVLPPRPAPVDPFGGPMRKLMRKIEEAAAEQRVEQVDESAALQRQRELEEQMRELESRREAEQRRAAEIAVRRQAASAAERQRPLTPVGNLREELRDPNTLRRAFVLKEVLGTPAGLR